MKFPTFFGPCPLIAKSLFIVTLSIIYALNAYANPHQNLVSIDQIYTLSITESEPKSEAYSRQVTLKGAGAIFTIELEKNTSLLEKFKLPPSNNQTLFKGKITGNSDSWVRLSEIEGVYSGTIYDGTELYIIDRNDQLNQLMSESQSLQFEQRSPSTQVMYKASDITNNGFCGIEGHNHGTSAFDYSEFVEELNLPHDSEATRQIEVALVADTEYADDYGDDTQQQMLSIMNDVDGIFSEQVNVHLSIVSSEVLTNNGSLTTVQPEPLVFAFRDYVFNEIGNPGVTHLFTGKNLQDNVLGIAFVSELCTSYGVGLSQNFGSSTFFVVAHELGHIFGAPHDNQSGSVCASTSNNFLMNPSINNQDQFSACSLAQMDSHINQTNVNTGGACIVNIGPVAPTIVSTGNPNATVGFPYTYDADNSLEVTGDTPLTFNLDIAPLGMGIDNSGTISWIPSAEQVGTQAVQITVSNDSGSDTQNFDILVSVAVDPSLNIIDFNTYAPTTYGETQDKPDEGVVVIEDGGATIAMTGNRWQKITFPYVITESTVLKFDFKTTEEADVQGIGLDNDTAISPDKTFNLFGTQAWGIEDFQYNGSGTFQSFTIPVGQYYTGEMEYLFFVLDHDIDNPNGNAFFKNIQVFEADVSLDITFIEPLEDNVIPAGELFSIEAMGSETANLPIDTVEFSLDQELWILATNFDGTFRLDDFGPVAEGPGELYARINSSIIQAIPYTAAIREPDEPIGYYFLNPKWVGSEVNIYALADNTILDINGSQQTLNEGELLTHTVTAQGEFVSANKNFSVGTEEDGLDMPVPTSFMGTEFVVPHIRDTHFYHMLSLTSDALVTVTVGDNNYLVELTAGIVETLDAGTNNKVSAGIIASNQPLLISHSTNRNGDVYPVPPLYNNLWGIRSTRSYFSALENDTSVSVYSSDGDVETFTLDAGELQQSVQIGSSIQGRGNAIQIVSDKPISAIQHADGDGVESSGLWPSSLFSNEFIIPVGAEYVAIACNKQTSVGLFNTDGEQISTLECSSQGNFPGKVYFEDVTAGSSVIASQPVFLMYETESFGDERNLAGITQNVEALTISYAGLEQASEITPATDFIALAIPNNDANVTILSVEFSLDGESWFSADLVDEIYQFNFGSLAVGQYTLSVRMNGNIVGSLSFEVVVEQASFNFGYYFIDQKWISTSTTIIAIANDTNLLIDDNLISLNQGESITHSISTQGEVIIADKQFSVGAVNDALDLPVPLNFAGNQFIVPNIRKTNYYNLFSPELDTAVELQIGTNNYSITVNAGEVFTFSTQDIEGASAIIESPVPILVSHSTNERTDSYPVPPTATELWGVRSKIAYVTAIQDNTSVTFYADNGELESLSINSGDVVATNVGLNTAEGQGSALRVVADGPIAAVQVADTDGAESTGFWPQDYFSTQFVLSVPTQYVAVVCSVSTSISLYSPAGDLLSTQNCLVEGDSPAKAYFGSATDGDNIALGSFIEANDPVYLIYESSQTNDERNMSGYIAPIN